ncbi:hydrogenase [Nibricoccus aquaticus]|uniref:Hydrogenase n=1 Tax=Nibricoccus aquaticus TaxID=2576891 RepID=A0A290Q2J8_9BACT|nr:TAT-variant-translocated molybdopterin oxidoreductase [Nibricoccus aquaticus]ATC62879.1 hydrogenase [Nibricoccus aquaticus]
MKRKVLHPEPSPSEQLNGPKYWRSLDEMAATPGFKQHLEREFPEGASNLDGVDRRGFFKLMAASFALGGVGLAAGCRRPEAHILPYGKSVEGLIPGLPLYFATAMPMRKSAVPVIAETHQGRPTKLEGNPSYAPYGGGTNAFVQASVLDLYDPDRATTHTIGGTAVTIAAIQDKLAGIGKAYESSQGAGLAFLAEESGSPTRAALVARLKAKFPKAIWAEYEPVNDTPPLAAAQAAFGKNVQPLYQFAKAKRIVSLDADFFHSEAASLYYAREFSKGRKVTSVKDEMNRLYVVESGFTLTGGMADHRLRLASSHMLALAGALAAQITGDSSFAPLAQGLDFKDKDKWIAACAKDLTDHRGQSLVVAGAHLPAEVHAIAYAINLALGNVGQTVDFLEVEAPSAASINDLASAIKAASVKTLVVLGGNPSYNAPADLDWAALQKSVFEVIRHGYYVDETSTNSAAHIGATHYLESWGDARTADGTIVAVQPMILPLFNGLTELEVLARISGEVTSDAYSLVYQTITTIAGGDADDVFRKFLHDGVLAGSSFRKASVSLSSSDLGRLLNNTPKFQALSKDNLEVRFTTDQKIDDGRFANNGWLQECPDPITKISWDNAILISPKLARELDIYPVGSGIQVARVEEADFEVGKENARLAEITIGGRTIKGPLHIQPGLSNYTLILPLGYGRTVSGRVGKGQGFDAYRLRTSAGMSYAVGATIKLTGERYKLANTQEHWSMEGRDIVREANFDEYLKNPGFVDDIGTESHSPAIYGADNTPTNDNKLSREERAQLAAKRATELPRGGSLYVTPAFNGVHQWGMAIDLNTCIGCNACIIACQAENNIPIVGKDQVMRGREMHWIRLDRYYSDGQADARAMADLFSDTPSKNRELPEDPQVSLQPIACAHCETAPCETVCPVNATVHDEEGLNGMAYNRCIGTRYCANNCPYKVRRFNFFDWNKRQLDQLYMGPLGESGMPELVKMVKNPDVTVRMRGVMEKCTYCVQRIQQAKIAQKVKAKASADVKIPDGTVKVACQQACPVDGVYFGDISDPTSEVSKAKAREQDYSLLGYLNVRPRTTFLGKLRNPNPSMPDYAAIKTPFSRQEYENKNHPQHGDGHGHGHDHSHGAGEQDSHGTPAKNEHGHTSLQNLKRLGGLV